jgi:ABC-type Fe3+ transport system substrate-binding protein
MRSSRQRQFLKLLRRTVFALSLIPSPLVAESRVILISPHNEAIRYEFGRGFDEWHRKRFGEGAAVEWRDAGGTADALRFVQSEFVTKPDGIGIDIFFGGGSEPFLLLADKQLALPYQPSKEILSGIPQSLNGIEVYDAGHAWYGAALSSFGILQNRLVQRRMKLPFVTRWEQLARPELYGWVGIGDPRNSGTMINMFEAFLQACGWERGWQLLAEVAGNARKFDRISSTTAKDVTLGETAYAFAIDFYAFTQIAVAGRSNMTFALPQDFTAISPDGIAILKGAPNRAVAQRFIDFVLGEEGQKLWFLQRGNPEGPQKYSIERMSVRPDFYKRFRDVSNIEFSPFELKQNFIYNAKLSRERREVVAALAGALLVDTLPELQRAWSSMIRRGLSETDRAELGRMPVTETEALQLSAGPWKNAVVRNQKKIEWQTWAQQKYRRIAQGRGSRVAVQKNHSPIALD